jgi:chromosome segregation ATPase
LVHARAVRLTLRRLEASMPISMAEIVAEKDQLRAEFAITMSRLEMSVEQMKAKTTSQLVELGRKSEAIARLKFELGDKAAALLALEAKERQLIEDLGIAQGELATKTAALAHVTTSSNDTSVTAGSQRVELTALRAQADALKGQLESYEKETKALWDHLKSKTTEIETSGRQLAEERARADDLANRVAELDRQLVAQTAEIAGARRTSPGARRATRRADAVAGGARTPTPKT